MCPQISLARMVPDDPVSLMSGGRALIDSLPPNVCCHLLAVPLKMTFWSVGCLCFWSSVLGSGAYSAQLLVDISLERICNQFGCYVVNN